ncbi:plasma membrane calcium-transporting ATPase 4-like [Schistocerca nitens]|uniref:plasma membrane calcium-transporting ATPase 4-like n=1 Tax=Schistocerca nitens TaxID=7011 RepID=UPI0021195350|nr:plasma membrane calcium-transporting ATPase 4-like [Schistocerca nitens]
MGCTLCHALCCGVIMALFILAVPMAQTLIHIYQFNNEWTLGGILHSTNSVATAIMAFAIMVPKSLPLIPTLSLAYALKKMMNDKILLHRFDTYETMGNVSVICTDKTGSLTVDRLQVVKSHICDTLYLSTPPFHNLPDPVGNIITHNISINTSYSSRLLEA